MSLDSTLTRPATLSVEIRGNNYAHLTLSGDVEPADASRMQAVMSVLLMTGVQHVILDLSTASKLSTELVVGLEDTRNEMIRTGGWLLVEGVEGTQDGLLDAFRAYQDAVRTA